MKKIIAALCCAAIVLSLAGCDKGENSSSGEEIVVTPTLYNMESALTKVYEAAGYTYDYETDAEGQEVLDTYCKGLGITWENVLLGLKDEAPSENVDLIKLFRSVGLSAADIEWSTIDYAYNLPNTTIAVVRDINLTADRDKFVETIRTYGVQGYTNGLLMAGVTMPDVGAISVPIFEECLNDEMNYDRLYAMYDTKKPLDHGTQLLFKTSERDAHFWVYTQRNGHSYIAFYPTVCNVNNSSKYLAEIDPESGTPLWEHYFIAYAKWAIDAYGVSMSEGIYNVTNDGVEVWWPLDEGKRSIELDVYESGLIRVVMSSDGRYDSYVADSIGTGTIFSDDDYTHFSTKFGLTNADVDTLCELAKIFKLPFADDPAVEKWEEFVKLYQEGLYVINHPEDLSKVTVSTIERSINTLCEYTVDKTGIILSTSETLLSEFRQQDTVENNKRMREFLTSIGAQDSVLMICGYNGSTSNVSYVKPKDPRLEEHKKKFLELCEDKLFLDTMQVWCVDTLGDENVELALADKFNDIDHDAFATFLAAFDEIKLNVDNTFEEYFNNLKDISAINAGPIVYTSIYSVSDVPESIANAKTYSATDMSAADDVIKELYKAIGSSNTNCTRVYRLYTISDDGDDTSSSSGGNTGGSISW